MGRVRNTFIKRNTKKILDKYPEGFSKDFDDNKKNFKGKVEFFSKKIRNRVAGYLAFIKKKGKSLKRVE